MKKVKIETLTPVHIGSGRELMKNTEFLHFQEEEEEEEDEDGYADVFAVIDEEKTLNIIGNEHIDKWVDIINSKGDLKEYLKKRKTNLQASDVAKRKIYVFATNFNNNKSLKEQLHDGRGKRYIPGSSIKGAIRTAVLSQKALQNTALAKSNLKGKRGFSGKELENKLFGSNANEDVFRFLQIGDAYFDYETIALKAEIFNLHGRGWKIKPGGSQLIEAIPDGANASFHFKINKDLLVKNKSRFETDFLSEKKLFKLINQHTISLLEKEIEFWNDEQVEATTIKDTFFDKLKELLNTANACTENEAILRIGFGSGWQFITGSWATNKDIMDDYNYDAFLKQARHKDYPDDVPFPKSRKTGNQGDIFGFVKLKMEE